ncbi:MAG: hypothetical protein IT201_01190 [Thermoleophilia bacterium]|nr:hypothetical protein [Thermoleophilia bacterium]
MAAPIRIGPLPGPEALDLAQALAVRGITGRPIRATGRFEVVVHDSHEDPDRLVHDLVDALEEWLADRGRLEVGVRIAGSEQTVHAA